MDFAPTCYLHLGDARIRVYDSFPIQYCHEPDRIHADIITTRLLCYSCPLSYPYTWFVYGNQAAIVNYSDLYRYTQQSYETTDDEVYILNDVDINDQRANERFEQAASHVPWACSGLTKKLISENLQVIKYCKEEEDEICVVCQVEFEREERVGVLECKHRYHPRCIMEWLVRQNVCPICKGQGLSV